MRAEPQIAVRVSRRFEASAERVFDAWLDPTQAGKFMTAGRPVQAEIDARIGGEFRFVDRQAVARTGEYLAFNRPRRLVFSYAVPRLISALDLVTVDIVPLEAGCEFRVTHELGASRAAEARGVEDSWQSVVEHLAATLGEGQMAPARPARMAASRA